VRYAGLIRLALTRTSVRSEQEQGKPSLTKHYERKIEMPEIAENSYIDQHHVLTGRYQVYDMVYDTIMKMRTGMEYVYEIEKGQGFLTPERERQREKIMFGIDTLGVFLETFQDKYDTELENAIAEMEKD